MKYLNSLLLASLFLSGATKPLLADEQNGDYHPYLTETFSIDLGVFFPENKLRIRVDAPSGGAGEEIDFQTEFRESRSDDIFSLNFGWRFGENWQLRAQYFESKAYQEVVLEEDVEWEDLIFAAGSGVATSRDFTLNRIFFARNFALKSNHEFGVGAGLHWLEFGASISGNIIDGSGAEGIYRTESVSASAPLPNIGAWYMYSISQAWAFRSRFDWMSAKVGDYDGRLINASLGINYQAFEHAGIGLSYNLFELDVGVRNSNWQGRWNTSYRGVFAHVSFYW